MQNNLGHDKIPEWNVNIWSGIEFPRTARLHFAIGAYLPALHTLMS